VRTALVILAALLSGCSVMGHVKVDGWPKLEVVEHHVPHKDMRDRCGKYVPALVSPEACAEFNLATGTCDIWFSADFPPAQAIKDHEREHCAGCRRYGDGEPLARVPAMARCGGEMNAETCERATVSDAPAPDCRICRHSRPNVGDLRCTQPRSPAYEQRGASQPGRVYSAKSDTTVQWERSRGLAARCKFYQEET